MKATSWFKLLAFSALLTVSTTSCNKEDDDDTTDAADNALADQTFNDVSAMADQAAQGDLVSFKTMAGCATVTHDSLNSGDADSITIDFGTVNCTGVDGRNRRGKVLIIYTGRYRDVGSVHTITFDNYFVNDNQVLGTKTVTNMGPDANGHTYFTVEVEGRIIRADNSGEIVWESSRVRTWVEGEATTVFSDDVYLVTGTATGTNANNVTFNTEITEGLRFEGDCRYITAGVAEVTPVGRQTRTIDFGDGTCDNEATVTIGTRTFTITLR